MSEAGQHRSRDERLDLARGLTMLIIFVAHVPANSWAEFIPARMGFSSGAEAFVLCSGLACGIAFGGAYRRQGWVAGTRRILRRIGQLWAAQLLAFLAFAALLLALDALLGGDLYRQRYSLSYLAEQPAAAVTALAMLAYVPVYFDILPLYILLLAAVPLTVAIATRSKAAALSASFGLWLLVQIWPLNLPAHPLQDRTWYFDPFAWQFLFFIGFGVTAGWFKPPEATRGRLMVAAAFILACVPVTFWAFHAIWPPLQTVFLSLYPQEAITTLHPLRLLHVLVLAWLFAALLQSSRAKLGQGALSPVVLIGQQSLITFLTGVFLSALAGAALDLAGRTHLTVAAANLAGMALLITAAYIARAVKARGRQLPIQQKETVRCPATS